MNKHLYIYCDGGFGNRFNSLIIGLTIAKKNNFTPIIVWPATSVCMSLFNDIFDTSYTVIDTMILNDFSKHIKEYEVISHHNELDWPTPVTHPESFTSLTQLNTYYQNSTKEKH